MCESSNFDACYTVIGGLGQRLRDRGQTAADCIGGARGFGGWGERPLQQNFRAKVRYRILDPWGTRRAFGAGGESTPAWSTPAALPTGSGSMYRPALRTGLTPLMAPGRIGWFRKAPLRGVFRYEDGCVTYGRLARATGNGGRCAKPNAGRFGARTLDRRTRPATRCSSAAGR